MVPLTYLVFSASTDPQLEMEKGSVIPAILRLLPTIQISVVSAILSPKFRALTELLL